MALSVSRVTEGVKTLLGMSDTTVYDEMLGIYVPAAMSSLETEGVPNVFTEIDLAGKSYTICVAHHVAKNIIIERLPTKSVCEKAAVSPEGVVTVNAGTGSPTFTTSPPTFFSAMQPIDTAAMRVMKIFFILSTEI